MRSSPPGQVAALLVLMVLALAVRGYRLGLTTLSTDEAFSWRLTRYPVPEVIGRTGIDVRPPLYYHELKAWVSLGGIPP